MKKVAVVLCNDMHMDIDRANRLLNHIQKNKDYTITCDYTDADIILVLTCAFGSNKMHSMRVLADVRLHCQKTARVIATGCLVKLNAEELEALPGIEVMNFEELLNSFCPKVEKYEAIVPQNTVIISEGCLHHCSYCVYPQIVGKYKSKPMEDILNEIEAMYETESTIFITGAQETADYGVDLYGKRNFATLMKEIASKFPNCKYVIGWFHPDGLTDEVISVIEEFQNIVGIMLHIQHVDDELLKAMHRTPFLAVNSKILRLRSARQDLMISTEVIVGFPGETEEKFNHLVSYLSKGYFNDIAVASYEAVLGTEAANLPNQVSEKEKQRRMNLIKGLFSATCYPADENSDSSIIGEYIKASYTFSHMPECILNDRQQYDSIAPTDTKAKSVNFEEHLSEILELIYHARTRYNVVMCKKQIGRKYSFEARKYFNEIIQRGELKEAIKRRAQEILLNPYHKCQHDAYTF